MELEHSLVSLCINIWQMSVTVCVLEFGSFVIFTVIDDVSIEFDVTEVVVGVCVSITSVLFMGTKVVLFRCEANGVDPEVQCKNVIVFVEANILKIMSLLRFSFLIYQKTVGTFSRF